MSQASNSVIIIVGPTAVGKTALAIELARWLDTEIISADSRQCFRELNIGVARPSEEELHAVKHHFIASHSIFDDVNAAVFEAYALQTVEAIFRHHSNAVMVGGTGLYVKAFCEGMDEIPAVEPGIRADIIAGYETHGLGWLQEQVRVHDPLFYASGEVQNPQRLMRALEVVLSTGKSIRTYQSGQKQERPFAVHKIGLDLPRAELYDRINRRVDLMMEAGLLQEVSDIFQNMSDTMRKGTRPNALQTVGYSELLDFLEGGCSLAEAVEKIKINTRHYAKRQLTWFRRDPAITWFHPADTAAVKKFLDTRLTRVYRTVEENQRRIHKKIIWGSGRGPNFGAMFSSQHPGQPSIEPAVLKASAFGEDFHWGVAIAAAQNEGAVQEDGRSLSIWDVFARRKGVIKKGAKPSVACDFYHRYKDDILLAKALGFNSFRFSISWSRVLPDGSGKVNEAGIRFYDDVIDECLRVGLIPFVTLYHWDLPQVLQQEGGWESPLINRWFKHFTKICAKAFGDRVKHWLVLNEPVGFTSLGYMLGKHAPGKKSLDGFLKSVHHAALAQADGGRVLRQYIPDAKIGTTFSCSEIIPQSDRPDDLQAARRLDLLMNRLFIEPLLGKGFPEDDMGLMDKMWRQNQSWKFVDRMQFDMDFIGLQNYFPVMVKHSPFIPILQATQVKASVRKVPHTAMGWEINPTSFYNIIKRFWKYGAIRELMITENGAAFKDTISQGRVNDPERIAYFQSHLAALLQAKKEGIKISGYFAWTLMDNFEWAEGYEARFGLVHVDFKTQLRTIKDSGHWWKDFFRT